MPYVVVRFGGEEMHRHEFEEPVTIGRDLSCDLWVGDPRLSRAHVRIEQDDRGRWMVVDLNSRNGVYLNDLRVTRFIPRDGEGFKIGNTKVIFHAGTLRVQRPATPLQTYHQSLMTPLVGKVSDHEAPALAATMTKVHRRPMPTPRPLLDAEPGEPLVKPFSLAFQRPAPKPILLPEQVAALKDQGPRIEAPSRSWLTTLLGRRAG